MPGVYVTGEQVSFTSMALLSLLTAVWLSDCGPSVCRATLKNYTTTELLNMGIGYLIHSWPIGCHRRQCSLLAECGSNGKFPCQAARGSRLLEYLPRATDTITAYWLSVDLVQEWSDDSAGLQMLGQHWLDIPGDRVWKATILPNPIAPRQIQVSRPRNSHLWF